jgi:hypothetical protein
MALLMRRATLRVACGLIALLLAGGGAGASQEAPGESAIKAAFLYNFTKFVDWPERAFAGSSAPFAVCVLADDAARRAIAATMRNESVRGRPVEVTFPADGDDLKACHVVYFGRQEDAAKRLASVRQSPVLTVGEGRRFLDSGGQIAFTLVGDRVRFDISRRAAGAAGLSISSKLLRVARRVEEGAL